MNTIQQRNSDLTIINELLTERIDEVLAEFGIDLDDQFSRYVGRCCIHLGDKCNAMNVNTKHNDYPGRWICFTHSCQEVFKPTVIGLIRGIISSQKYGWTAEGDKMASFPETMNWIKEFLGTDYEKSQKAVNIERRRFIAENNTNSSNRRNGIPRSEVIKWLDIPANEYLNKGYSKEVLTKYDCGFYKYPNRRFSDRVLFPCYNKDFSVALGFTGRTIHPQCTKCGMWHFESTGCPKTSLEMFHASKWVHSPKEEFDVSSYLFNFYNSLEYIKKTKTIILCESIGDVLRLEDNNIKGAVAIFGTSLKANQATLLDSAGVQNVIVLLNGDEPGIIGSKKLKEKYRRYYNLKFPKIDLGTKDIGDLSNDEVMEKLSCLKS
jgi:5S rRNA maturation endonuclease (ribonuclease M5)